MNIKKVIVSSIILWIIGTIYGILTCGWLFNWVYQIPPIIWKDPEAMMSTANYVGSLGAGLLSSIIFVVVYAILYNGIPKKGVSKGLCYALIIWFVGPLVGISMMPFYMTIATTVVVYWILSQLVYLFIAGIIVGGIYKEK